MPVASEVPCDDSARPVPGVVLAVPPLFWLGEGGAGRPEDEESGLVLAFVVERDEIVLAIAGDVGDRELRSVEPEGVRPRCQPHRLGECFAVRVRLAHRDPQARISDTWFEQGDLRFAVSSEVAARGDP